MSSEPHVFSISKIHSIILRKKYIIYSFFTFCSFSWIFSTRYKWSLTLTGRISVVCFLWGVVWLIKFTMKIGDGNGMDNNDTDIEKMEIGMWDHTVYLKTFSVDKRPSLIYSHLYAFQIRTIRILVNAVEKWRQKSIVRPKKEKWTLVWKKISIIKKKAIL